MQRETTRELYLSVDAEVDGQVPGPDSMVSLGACAGALRDTDGGIAAIDPDAWTFYAELRPIANGYKRRIESLRGQLLIAGATLPDPNFARTVVLICEHSEAGALGLVLNRPGELGVDDVAPELSDLVGEDARIDQGGPVQPDALLVLGEFEDPSFAGMPVVGSVGLVGEGLEISDLVDVTIRARAFAGYAGWGPGQLDAELERDDWFVAPAGIDDIFDTDADELWRRVLERKGGHFALVARMPIDPSVN